MKDYIDFLKKKIKKNIDVEKIVIVNNSHKHKSHKSFDSEKYHLLLEIESKYLKSLSKLEAQRSVMQILKDEFKKKIHALEIKIK